MELDIGYNVVTEDGLNEYGTFEQEMSIVEFLRRIERSEKLPADVTVRGLERFLRYSDNPEELSDHIHDQLRDNANQLMKQRPIIQFVIDEIEYWDEPVLPEVNGRISLKRIFGEGLEQRSVDWYWSQFNVQS